MGKQCHGNCQKRRDEHFIKKEIRTEIVANVDVGWGNRLFIRGDAGGLNWERGIPMQNVGSHLWCWTSTVACHKDFQYKVLLNDHIWCLGENLMAHSFCRNCIEPSF